MTPYQLLDNIRIRIRQQSNSALLLFFDIFLCRDLITAIKAQPGISRDWEQQPITPLDCEKLFYHAIVILRDAAHAIYNKERDSFELASELLSELCAEMNIHVHTHFIPILITPNIGPDVRAARSLNSTVGGSGYFESIQRELPFAADSTCIGCGCTDSSPCLNSGRPCHWLVVDREQGMGVCSQCGQFIDSFRDRQQSHSPSSASSE